MNTWVIGGTTGIGAAVVEVMEDAQEVPLVTGLEVDVSTPSRVSAFVREHPGIDQVVYCAGYNEPQMIGDINWGDMYDTFSANVLGFINVLDALKSQQNEAGGWPVSIVAISSDAARVPMRGSIAYCSSKAALSHAVRCAARELAPLWRVNAVAPGIVDGTPMTEKLDVAIPKLRGWTHAQARGYEESMIPMGRRATVDEVAEVIISVLKGPQYMTGSIVEITGGK